jgi:N-methylhydantoinase A
VRLRARGAVDPPDLHPADPGGSVADARRERRDVTYDGEQTRTPVYDRARLPLGAAFDGPAVVEGSGSTTVVRPGQSVRVDEYGNLVVETTGGER